jgi:hypothetical protein
VPNENNELIPQRVLVGYRMCIDFRKVNKVTKKDHYSLPFIDQMLERLSKKTHFCFLDGYSGFSQIAVRKHDQEKTTFTCPYGTYAYIRMPFCRWISCRKNTGYHTTDPKIRTQGAERVRSRIAMKHSDGSLESSNALCTAERDAELYPGSGPLW